MKLSSRVDRIGGEGADAWAIHSEARAAARRGEDVLVLSVGDPDFPTPAPIVDRAVAALRAGDTHYTGISGREDVRAAIAERFSARAGHPVGPGNVVLFAGAQNALFAACQCLLEPGDEVLALDPMYVTYEATVGAAGACLVRAAQPADNGFRPDPEAVEAAITARTRALMLTTPNNPTGVVMSAAELAALADVAKRHDLWVIADEVYADLVFDGEHRSIAALPGMAERTATVSSVSKSHAMTGWRVGWAIAPEMLAGHLVNLGLCMLYGLPGFTQAGALAALTTHIETASEMRDVYRRRRDLVCARLAEAPGVKVLTPQAGMFVMADVRAFDPDGAAFAWALYRATGVAVLDAGAFGTGARGWVRISYTLDEARLEEACARIVAFARERRAGAA